MKHKRSSLGKRTIDTPMLKSDPRKKGLATRPLFAPGSIKGMNRQESGYSFLLKGIIEGLGEVKGSKELPGTFQDVVNHGADAGFGNFIYYSDTVKFFEKYSEEIFDLLAEDADSAGQSILELIATFRIQNTVTDYSTFANLMTWYALETVAHRETGE